MFQKFEENSLRGLGCRAPKVPVSGSAIGKFNSKLNFYKLIPYLVDRCVCPAPCRSRQMLEKNILSWALAGTGSVLFTRQAAV